MRGGSILYFRNLMSRILNREKTKWRKKKVTERLPSVSTGTLDRAALMGANTHAMGAYKELFFVLYVISIQCTKKLPV